MDRNGVRDMISTARAAEVSSARGYSTMVATIVIKGIVWVWCARVPSTAVKALAQDAENDGKSSARISPRCGILPCRLSLVFFNIMSLSFPAVGQALKSPLLDPIGGMVLSTYIIWQWCIVSTVRIGSQ